MHVNKVLVSDLAALNAAIDRLAALIELVQHQSVTHVRESIGPVHADVTALAQRIDAMADRVDEGDAGATRAVEQMDAKLEEARRLYTRAEGSVRSIWPRLAQVDLFLDEVRRSLPLPPPVERLAELPTAFDRLYPAFEEAFRGPAEHVKALLTPYLRDLSATPSGGPVLDLGCGRGELLSVLHEAGLDAYGVDLLESNVKCCRTQGLRVEQADALVHLATVAAGSLRAVTAIHLIEHFAFAHQLELIDRAWAALAPEGILLVETPNPENLIVGSSTFRLDPSHKQPVPPALLHFLLGARGFGDVEIRRLERPEWAALEVPWDYSSNESEPAAARLAEVVRSRLIAAPDYAVIGRKLG